MYHVVRDDGLGFSLKPPRWLRNIVGKVAGGATEAQAAVQAVQGNYPAVPPQPSFTESMPGWLIPAAIGVGLLLVMKGRR